MNSRNTFLILVITLVLVFAWALLTPEENLTLKVSKKIQEQKQKSDLYMKGATFSEAVGGTKFWEIRAINSFINKTTQKAEMNDINGTFFKNGKPSLRIIAPKVFWDMKNKSIEIVSPIGYEEKSKFETQSLIWSLDDKMITAKDKIVFERDNLMILSGSMKADTELEKMILQDSPFAAIKNKGQPDIEVRAQMFEVNAKTGHLSAKGKAKLKRGQLIINSNEMAYEAKQDLLFAKGGTRIDFKDISARCSAARYNIKREVVSLFDNVFLKRGQNELNGDRIDISLKDETISIKGRRSRAVIEEELLSPEAK